MPKFPSLTPKEVARTLEKIGFVFVRQKGSHKIYVKGKTYITLPWHNKDIKIGTVKSIIKQSGLTVQEFLKLI
jgi:predicted RNA binding protein YcfA (HicA-like mRNA interferase family)